MNGQFNIVSLMAMAEHMNYQPALAGAVNRLLRTRNREEYEIALKEATQAALGYEIKDVSQFKDYGQNPNTLFAGMPLWQPLTIKATETGESDFLLDSAVVSFNMTRNIVKTVVQGRDSSVKEFINNGDYAININGILCENTYNYPLESVVKLDTFMKKKQALEIEHEVLNAIGVYEIVVESYDCQRTPHINCQTYAISAVSNIPVPLQVDDLPQYFPRF